MQSIKRARALAAEAVRLKPDIILARARASARKRRHDPDSLLGGDRLIVEGRHAEHGCEAAIAVATGITIASAIYGVCR